MSEKREKDLKDLSQLIVAALTRDEGVMNALADLKKRKVIESSTLLGLALKINDLLEISGSTISSDSQEKAESAKEPAVEAELDPVLRTSVSQTANIPVRARAMIDGRQLSAEEILFEEWAQAKFNEKEWLRKVGLAW